MKILIYGAGVIGSIFAGKLALSGNDITVLARGKRLNEIKQNGIILVNPKSKAIEKAKINVIDTLYPEDIYDYILVVMQKTQVGDILSALSQNHSKNIVFVVNTADGYQQWADSIGAERLMLGFPSAGGERKNGSVNYFIGKGIQRVFQTTTFGEYNGQKSVRVKRLIKLFNGAKIPSVFCSDMDSWQKTHVALVTNIANALLALCSSLFFTFSVALKNTVSKITFCLVGLKNRNIVINSHSRSDKVCFSVGSKKSWFFFTIFHRPYIVHPCRLLGRDFII